MDAILDTDIASTFGKIERFDLLKALFPNSILFISDSVEHELEREEKWRKVADNIKKKTKTAAPTKAEERSSETLLSKRRIGKAEAECIAIAKSRNMLLLTNDRIAIKEARKAGVDVMDLRAIWIIPVIRLDIITEFPYMNSDFYITQSSEFTIVRELWKQNILTKKSAAGLVSEIESKDRIIFANKELIFEE